MDESKPDKQFDTSSPLDRLEKAMDNDEQKHNKRIEAEKARLLEEQAKKRELRKAKLNNDDCDDDDEDNSKPTKKQKNKPGFFTFGNISIMIVILIGVVIVAGLFFTQMNKGNNSVDKNVIENMNQEIETLKTKIGETDKNYLMVIAKLNTDIVQLSNQQAQQAQFLQSLPDLISKAISQHFKPQEDKIPIETKSNNEPSKEDTSKKLQDNTKIDINSNAITDDTQETNGIDPLTI